MSKNLSLTVLENGPLKISGDTMTVQYCGEPITVDAGSDIYVCRCGESSNPPFCDGSHAKTGFVAEPPTGERKDVHVWEGKTIRTFFNPNTCMHVFYCKPLKELRKRELEGDAEAAAEIARVVQSCPSGALSYEAKDVPAPAPVAQPDIDIMEGGELRIQCAFEINADLQERQASDRATLCRCGLSKNKPWCDGRHKKRPDFR
ncbi:MAG: CDGSH iron-sulfur domain-containing protein [Deltaproteobacteria bacterium]|nr:CDGSH iron-sulfur domain-containing protein [Deltaproteobacteria bacterium]